MNGTVRRWPLILIAAPAAVAIWSSWVGLGELRAVIIGAYLVNVQASCSSYPAGAQIHR